MNQGNINQNNNGVQNPNATSAMATPGNVKPQPMPATPGAPKPQPIPTTPGNVQPTPLNNNSSQIFAQAPEFKQESKQVIPTAPVQAPAETPKQQESKQKEEVAPTQNIVNTTKKKGSNIALFIVIILIGVFVYKIDDVLEYFNQRYSPTPEPEIKTNDSEGLTDGYLLIGSSKGFIKLKNIKFSNARKEIENTISIDYLPDRKITNTASLNIEIQLYDSNKVMIYNEMFSVNGNVEELLTKQYKIALDEEKYNNAFYALVLVKK